MAYDNRLAELLMGREGSNDNYGRGPEGPQGPLNPDYEQFPGPWAPDPIQKPGVHPYAPWGGTNPERWQERPAPRWIEGGPNREGPPAQTWWPDPNFIDPGTLPTGELPPPPGPPGLKERLGHLLFPRGGQRIQSALDWIRNFNPQLTKTTKGFLPDGSPALGPEGEQLTREQIYNLRSPFKYDEGDYALSGQNPLVGTDESYYPSGKTHYEPWENQADE